MPTAKARHISLKHKKKDLYFTSLVSVIMDADAVTALLTGLGLIQWICTRLIGPPTSRRDWVR